MIRAVLTALFLSSLTAFAADNWPEYRGPHGDGHSDAKGLPTKWGEKENVKWKTPVHDKGWSSPVVWGNQVWLTTATAKGEKLYALAFDRETGKMIHDLLVFEINRPDPKDPYHVWAGFNSYSSPTPVIEEGRVYVHFGVAGTACIDTKTGKILWSIKDKELDCNHHRGAASSPVLVGDLLILTFDGFDVQFLAAIDKNTGKVAWKKDRKFHPDSMNGDLKKAYSTPLLIKVGGKDMLVSPSADATAAYDPKTGDEIWRVVHGGMNASLRPVFGAGKVFTASSDGGKQLVAIRPEGTGNITKTNIEWTFGKGTPNRSSFLIEGDKLYMVNSGGIVTCLDTKDGKELNKTRLEARGAAFTASPIISEGKIYIFDEKGGGYIVSATPELNVIATNTLEDGCKGSPAAVGKDLFIRTQTQLYCLETK
ncbi:PQQ-binding-like beta-propeller repeat protein [Zavarzinella formosa]|uniref:PQQ-binding-like beta-propeller repeat protein n=1 Tax=Zavarzinella formosa TaxID=360055 RepID=UPI0002FAE805|nr:PQQ-binding-like beta-propeller repeat protein [Zavarzinella formosa]